MKSARVDDHADSFGTGETHPEHSAAELDGHGQRERQLEFRDVDRQAGLRREGDEGDNSRSIVGLVGVEISEEIRNFVASLQSTVEGVNQWPVLQC